MKSYNNNNNLSWRLNVRLRLTIILLFIIFLVAYQLFIFTTSDLKQWWNNDESKETKKPNEAVETIVLSTGGTSQVKLDYGDVVKNVSLLAQIQFNFPAETPKEKEIREFRKESIKQGFLHAWKGYAKYAWGSDEVLPLTNVSRNNFNGWGATMVDALDTMWIMDLKEEFKSATEYIANVDFTRSNIEISVFETVIRYLGGLLSAYELSGDEMLLQKAKELGEAMIPAFNSPSGLPYNTWNLTKGLTEGYRPYSSSGILAQVGTLQLEYMKLAQLTGNSTFFYKVQKVTDVLDKADKQIPGLYPLFISQDSGEFTNYKISFGGMGDSFYEYLIKQYIYVGGAVDQYKRMYEESIESMHKYLIKEGQVKDQPDLLFLGQYSTNDNSFYAVMEHLACFAPGMLAIGSKILDRPKDLEVAIKLGKGCYWAYNSTSSGIGPESFFFLQKDDKLDPDRLNWLTMQWNDNILPHGVYRMTEYYLLRPETIESLFILYRITGDKSYQEKGWEIWKAIEKWCKTETAYSGLDNVMGQNIIRNNDMESFFFAETLKYLYLLFSTPDVISLDTYVFNTEAHPFLRMTPH